MPELDPFEARLTHAVHAFADRAQTSVDAAAVARQAAGHRRTGVWAALERSVPIPVPVLVGALLLVAFAGWSVSGGGPFPVRIWLGPVATPTASPTPAPSPVPIVTPFPTPDGEGDEAVAGIETVVTAWQPAVAPMAIRDTMNDPRVEGNGTWRVEGDLHDGVWSAWGAMELINAGGAWQGSCTGSLWEGGAAGTRSCWLVGSGDYEGYGYQITATWDQGTGDVRGVIVPRTSPEP